MCCWGCPSGRRVGRALAGGDGFTGVGSPPDASGAPSSWWPAGMAATALLAGHTRWCRAAGAGRAAAAAEELFERIDHRGATRQLARAGVRRKLIVLFLLALLRVLPLELSNERRCFRIARDCLAHLLIELLRRLVELAQIDREVENLRRLAQQPRSHHGIGRGRDIVRCVRP